MAIVKFTNYETFKGQFDRCMNATANNFVMIGYLLKQARDTEILKESGYAGMGEFAKAEYGLDESTTSRFISICERYGNGEDRLIPEYEPFGYAKLSEMLTLPEHISEVISPELTREEIREIKQEVKEEQAITPVEVMLEPQKKEDADTRIEVLVLREHLRYKPSEFKKLYDIIKAGKLDVYQEISDVLAPQGLAMLVQRVPGHGKYMLKINGIKEPVTFINVREETNTVIDWEDFTNYVAWVFDGFEIPAADQYKQLYGEEMVIAEAPAVEKKPDRVIKSEPKKPAKAVEKPQKTSESPKISPESPQKVSESPEMTSAPEEKPAEDDFMNKPEEKKEEIAPAQSEIVSKILEALRNEQSILNQEADKFFNDKILKGAEESRSMARGVGRAIDIILELTEGKDE